MKKKLKQEIERMIDSRNNELKSVGFNEYPVTSSMDWLNHPTAYATVVALQDLSSLARSMGIKLKYNWF